MPVTSFNTFQAQQKYLDELQKSRPELFVSNKLFTEEDVLPQLGITGLNPNRANGFLRLYPQDFIVEEVRSGGDNSYIEPRHNSNERPDGKSALFADLVKIGISTLEAISRLATALDISPDKIGYAGIKDSQALTSQRISLSGITKKKLEEIKVDGLFLTNIHYGQGAIHKSDLAGNAFTIFIRTEKELDDEALLPIFQDIKKNGFLNFYQSQRFGGPRLMSHHLGREILRGDYENTIRMLLTRSSDYDIKLIREMREECEKHYGNWTTLKEIYSLMPYTFQNEIKLLSYLEQNPRNFIGALIEVKEQTTLWIYAYASLLFNHILSLNPTQIPNELPLLLSDDPADIRLYERYLEGDDIHSLARSLAPFKFIQLKKRLTPTRIFPNDLMFMSTSEGVICHFGLDKGAYATTFLMNVFELYQGLPVPSWVKGTSCDTKKYLQIGTNEPAMDKLKDYVFSVADEAKKI